MTDYKELLRRAVQALPENNGQARRAVYEKARAALVGQLRAINPPLAARDITTHRLQLEDCIRQVEQEASEAVIAGMQEPTPPPPKPPATEPTKAESAPANGDASASDQDSKQAPAGSIEEIIAAEFDAAQSEGAKAAAPVVGRQTEKAAPKVADKPAPKPTVSAEPDDDEQEIDDESIEDDAPAPPPPSKLNGHSSRPLPSIVARAEAAKSRAPTAFGIPADKPYDNGRRGPSIEPRKESGPRLEPAVRGASAARQQVVEPAVQAREVAIAAAMSSVREVELEEPHGVDPQGAIDRAIATLDREARGEADSGAGGANSVAHAPEPAPRPASGPKPTPEPEAEIAPLRPKRKSAMVGGMFRDKSARDEADKDKRAPRKERKDRKPAPRRESRPRPQAGGEAGFQRPASESERGGINALTIFLAVFAVLLVAAGAGGVWAWREGYINPEAMFGGAASVEQVATAAPQANPAAPNESESGPGNTQAVEPNLPVEEPKAEERLPSTEPAVAATTPLALTSTGDEQKTEERLPGDSQGATALTAEAAVSAIDPANMAGSQSLLLEASDNGTTGAVPFSGTVEWSKGTDETGAPTLVATAAIPARNLTVDVLIRRNADPSLPASHLMEINFTVAESFIGGSVAGLPGVLLKNEELVQGAALVGASARVVGNTFLFALSASPSDSATNVELLTSRKWMDLAIIYATGKRAIITLEKDDAAEQMFRDVFSEWAKAAST